MKLRKKQRVPKKILLITAIIIVALVAGFGAWYLWLRNTNEHTDNRPVNTVNYGPPTSAEQQVGNQQKQQIVDQQKQDNNQNQSVTPQITIIRTFQDPTGFNLRTQVTGVTTGECDITITKNGQPTITKTFPVVFEATTASCQNTPIPTSEFSTGGTWDVHVIVKKDSAQSAPTVLNGVEIKK